MLGSFFLILGFGLLIWLMIRTIKNQPELFSKDNLNKSFTTIGILALILIVVVGFSIMLLR